MKKVSLFLLISIFCLSAYAMTKRPKQENYEKVDGLAPLSKPISGAEIFNSLEQYSSWQMARAVIRKDDAPFDFEKYSLLGVWLGKPFHDECIAVASVSIKETAVSVSAYPVKCSGQWDKPYIYYKLPKTDKRAVYIELVPSK